ncbi:MAG: sporulation protein YhbH [Solirubrobacterales bacterium]|nr:sporulation protein YhbH [Solirubrobacterales bacterium]
MTVVGHDGLPHEQGSRDALHHRDRVRRKIVEQLKERIGEEDIIASGPEKKLRIPVKGTRQWRFIYDRGQGDGVGQGDGEPGDVLGDGDGPGSGAGPAGDEPGEELYEVWLDMEDVEELLFSELALPRLRPRPHGHAVEEEVVYDDIARKGPQVDKRATLRANLDRNARRGAARIGDVDREDLRYVTYRERPKPRHQAVVFCAMDISASMGNDRKRMARLFFYWCVQFLRRRYDQTQIVFVGHTTEAWEMDEHEFFSRVESGGTRASSAYELVGSIQRERYPAADWNVYVLHTSDGDNFGADNPHTLQLIRALVRECSLVGYLEVDGGGSRWGHGLSAYLAANAGDIEGFVSASAADDRELWPALKRFFARDDVAAAVTP